MRIATWILFGALALVAACGGNQGSSAPSSSPATGALAAPDVDGAAAKKLVQSGARLIDVRTREEYAQKHIDGAENLPLDTLEGKDIGPKDKPLVLYCQSGARSLRAAEILKKGGYTEVHVLGPMSRWDE